MKQNRCIVINISYKVVCTIVLLSMVIYWIFKFVKDEDLCLVDYKMYYQADEEKLPTFTLCITDPFIDEQIRKVDSSLNSSSYIDFLQGNERDLNLNLKRIEYNNVTVNLKNDITRIVVEWRNGSKSEYSYYNSLNPISIFDSFDGFVYNGFMKCYGHEILETYKRNVNTVVFYYAIESEFGNFMKKSLGNVAATFQYSKQILKNSAPYTFIRNDKSTTLAFKINNIEILKRRYKGRSPCKKNWKFFDDIVLKEHISSRGCRPPYLNRYNTFPICSTSQSMKNAAYNYYQVKNEFFSSPCQAMTKIEYSFSDNFPFLPPNENEFGIFVQYPEEFKVIIQSQAVDSHSLVGNIGGYIGLFLGRKNA